MYKFSNGSFYPYALKESYEAAGTWPVFGLDVDHDIFVKFSTPPEDKKIGSTDDGAPCWINVPLPTHKELIYIAETSRQQKLDHADSIIKDWRVELGLGEISDDDKVSLTAWIVYIKALKAIDTSKAPDITWPDIPA